MYGMLGVGREWDISKEPSRYSFSCQTCYDVEVLLIP